MSTRSHLDTTGCSSRETTHLLHAKPHTIPNYGRWDAMADLISGFALTFFSLGCNVSGRESLSRAWSYYKGEVSEEGLPAAFTAEKGLDEVFREVDAIGKGLDQIRFENDHVVRISDVISEPEEIKESVLPAIVTAISEGKRFVCFPFQSTGEVRLVTIDIESQTVRYPIGFTSRFTTALSKVLMQGLNESLGLKNSPELFKLHRALILNSATPKMVDNIELHRGSPIVKEAYFCVRGVEDLKRLRTALREPDELSIKKNLRSIGILLGLPAELKDDILEILSVKIEDVYVDTAKVRKLAGALRGKVDEVLRHYAVESGGEEKLKQKREDLARVIWGEIDARGLKANPFRNGVNYKGKLDEPLEKIHLELEATRL